MPGASPSIYSACSEALPLSFWGVLASLVGGFTLLALAANVLVDSSAGIARSLSWSPAIVGALFIGFGTSLPELFVSVVAALKDQPEIAIGNALGSNLANLMLVAGSAAIFAPLALPKDGRIQAWILVGALTLLSAFCWDGDLSALDGVPASGSILRRLRLSALQVWRDFFPGGRATKA